MSRAAAHDGDLRSRLTVFLLGTGPVRRVWPLTLLLAGLGLAFAIPQLGASQPLDVGVTLPWWAFALIVAVIEFPLIHLHVRSEAHSFTLGELALSIGLFLVPPGHFIIGAVIGAAIAKSRQAPVKLAFNTALWGLQASVAAAVFRAVVDPADPFGARGLGAALASMAVLGVIGVVAVTAAIAIVSGRLRARPLKAAALIAGPVNIANTGLGLIASYLIVNAPLLLAALVGPVTVLFLAYRAFVLEHQRHGRLQVVYQATRSVLEAPDVSTAVEAVLAQAREVFRSEIAQIVLFPERAGEGMRVTTLAVDGGAPETRVVNDLVGTAVAEIAFTRRAERLDDHGIDLRGGLVGMGPEVVHNMLVAPLEGERRLVGAIAVANRLGDVGGFDVSDLLLLETLAGHAGVAIGNGRLEQTLDELRELQAELAQRATQDALTGLANRAHFAARLAEAVEDSGDRQVGLVYVDLDDFKDVNDRFGHAAGDEMLKAVAARLTSCLREGDVAGRLGGDEFAVLIPSAMGSEQLARLGDRIQAAVERPVEWNGRLLEPRVSMGMTLAAAGASADSLLVDGDTAMYHAKRAGKGRLAVYDHEMRSARNAHEDLVRAISGAVGDGELVLHYQPIVALDDGAVMGVEALVRWDRPGVGMVSPNDFIPIAEEAGLIGEIGHWVVREACSQVARWRSNGLDCDGLSLCVNVASGQLNEPDFTGKVLAALHASGLAASSLVLEVTEEALSDRSGSPRGELVRLRERGIRIALDNFGTGMSSLARLSEQPVDLLKIPSTTVAGMGVDGDAYVEALASVGRSIGLPTIAETVETDQQLERLRVGGCDFGQGHAIAPPMPPADYERWMDSRVDANRGTLIR